MIVICIWELGNLIGCESVNWVCARLGIKGVRCSHSGVGGWGEEGGGVVTSTYDGSEASESVMQVNTTLIVPSPLVDKYIDSHKQTRVYRYHYVHI